MRMKSSLDILHEAALVIPTRVHYPQSKEFSAVCGTFERKGVYLRDIIQVTFPADPTQQIKISCQEFELCSGLMHSKV